mmetsp:Transcript_27824/g.33838  ORF Transcript_27824/g.33838 Transcript_27824/m.33838 type:complete len:90 (-) Transcript_27824:68-337(-)
MLTNIRKSHALASIKSIDCTIEEALDLEFLIRKTTPFKLSFWAVVNHKVLPEAAQETFYILRSLMDLLPQVVKTERLRHKISLRYALFW